MKGMKYHDYIWDLGGTLLDNYETSTAAFVETLALYGITEETIGNLDHFAIPQFCLGLSFKLWIWGV